MNVLFFFFCAIISRELSCEGPTSIGYTRQSLCFIRHAIREYHISSPTHHGFICCICIPDYPIKYPGQWKIVCFSVMGSVANIAMLLISTITFCLVVCYTSRLSPDGIHVSASSPPNLNQLAYTMNFHFYFDNYCCALRVYCDSCFGSALFVVVLCYYCFDVVVMVNRVFRLPVSSVPAPLFVIIIYVYLTRSVFYVFVCVYVDVLPLVRVWFTMYI